MPMDLPIPRLRRGSARKPCFHHLPPGGQSLVEFALVLPVLILILATAIDFGRVFFSWVNLTSAARVGAAYAASNPSASFGPGSEYAVQVLADRNDAGCPLAGAPAPPPPSFSSGKDVGSLVTVTLGCDFRPAMPLIQAVVGGTVRVTATVRYPVRAGVVSSDPSPLPTPTPVPTPTPPAMCSVPNLIGLTENTQGVAAWTAKGFAEVNYSSQGPPGFTIQYQSQVSDISVPCDSKIIVKPKA